MERTWEVNRTNNMKGIHNLYYFRSFIDICILSNYNNSDKLLDAIKIERMDIDRQEGRAFVI